MSFWFESQENGRRTITLMQGGDLMLWVFGVALLVAIAVTNPGLPLALYLVGFVCFMIAKLSLLRQGIWFSWGTRLMTPGYARLYRTGYVIMVVGMLLCFSTLLIPVTGVHR